MQKIYNLKKCIRKRKRPILFSLFNTIMILVLSYVMNNQPVFTGENLKVFFWSQAIKEYFLGNYIDKDLDSSIFINVSYDKSLTLHKDIFTKDTLGVTDITDRKKLNNLLGRITAIDNYKYIILDIRFEKGNETEFDSVLFSVINNSPRIIIANHKDIVPLEGLPLEKTGISDYYSTLLNTSFCRFEYLHDKKASLPLLAYKDLSGNTITPRFFNQILTSQNKLCYKSLFLQFSTEPFNEFSKCGNKNYYHLGKEVLSKSDSDLSRLIDNKVVVIGNMIEDVHDTYVGKRPGSLIVYRALSSLWAGKNILSWFNTFIQMFVWFLISYSLFLHVPILYKIPFIKNYNSRLLHFSISFLGYGFVLLVFQILSFIVFGVVQSILIPSLYLSLLKLLINYKRTKI